MGPVNHVEFPTRFLGDAVPRAVGGARAGTSQGVRRTEGKNYEHAAYLVSWRTAIRSMPSTRFALNLSGRGPARHSSRNSSDCATSVDCLEVSFAQRCTSKSSAARRNSAARPHSCFTTSIAPRRKRTSGARPRITWMPKNCVPDWPHPGESLWCLHR